MVLPLNLFPPQPEMLISGWKPCIGEKLAALCKAVKQQYAWLLNHISTDPVKQRRTKLSPTSRHKEDSWAIESIKLHPPSLTSHSSWPKCRSVDVDSTAADRCIKGRRTESEGGTARFRHAVRVGATPLTALRPQFQERTRVLTSSTETGAASSEIPAVILRYRQSSQTHGDILQMGATLIPCDSRSSEQRDGRGFLHNGFQYTQASQAAWRGKSKSGKMQAFCFPAPRSTSEVNKLLYNTEGRNL